MIAYLDTSALVKLAREEAESQALGEWIRTNEPALITSVIGDVELASVGLLLGESVEVAARRVASRLTLLPLTAGVVDTAKRLPPQVMRSLDAIHVATALALGPDCDVVVGYDARMIDAARVAGLTTASPGAAETTP